MNRFTTPPPPSADVSSSDDTVSLQLTPDRVRLIELNRLRAKAKLRAKAAELSQTAESSASGSSSLNANNKRPLQVTPADSTSPTAPSKKGSSRDATAANKDLAPLKRDSRLGNYFEYDLSKMVNSKAGFLLEDGNKSDERTKMLEKQRAAQRNAQKLDPPIFLDPEKNPKCQECDSIDIDQLFKRVFGLLVCEKCKTEKPEKYSLLTKTECRDDYLLTDPELKDTEILPHLLKANPHKSTWNNMMLFVRCQVENFAFEKWGSPEALDAEFERRQAMKKQTQGKKFAKSLRELRRKTRESAWQVQQDAEHRHEYGPIEGEEDERGGRKGVQRCIECGFEIEVEEL